MSHKYPPTWIKPALEYGPIIAFFVAYLYLKDDVFTIGGVEYEGFIIVTALFVPLIVLSTFLMYMLSKTVSKMQIFTAVLVVIFGGLTVWLNDERFIKLKPTIIYLVMAALLGIGLLRGQSYLAYVMEGLLPLHHEGWMKLTRRMTFFFIAMALINEGIWRFFSTETWVYFKTFGLPIILFAFLIAQSGLLQTYEIKDKDKE